MADFKSIELRFGVDFEYSIDDGVNWIAGTANTDYTVTPESGGNGKVKVRSVNNVTSIPSNATNKANVREINIRNGSTLTTLLNAFNGFSSLEAFRLANGANITTMQYAFKDTISLNSEKFNIDPVFTNLTNVDYMFGNSGITIFPNFDLSNVTSANYMFKSSKLKAIGNIELQSCTSAVEMFNNTELEVIGEIKVNNLGSLYYFIRNNSKLKFIGNIEANKTANIRNTFTSNTKLKIIGLSINRIVANLSNNNISTITSAYSGCSSLISPYKLIQTNSSEISSLLWDTIPTDTAYPTEIEKTELATDQTYLSDHSLDYIPFIFELEKSTNTSLIGAISINPVGGTYYKIDNNQNTRGTIIDGIHNVSFSLNTPTATTFGSKKVTLYNDGAKSITINGTNIEVFSDATGATSVATVDTTETVKAICVNGAEDAIYVLLGTINLDKTNTSSFNQTIKKYSLLDLTVDAGFGTKTILNNPLEEISHIMIETDGGSLRMISTRFNIGENNLVPSSTIIRSYSDVDLSILNDSVIINEVYDVFTNHNIINYGINLINTTNGNTNELVIPDRS